MNKLSNSSFLVSFYIVVLTFTEQKSRNKLVQRLFLNLSIKHCRSEQERPKSKRTWVVRLVVVYDELVGTRRRHFARHVHNIVSFSQDDQPSHVAVDICWKILCRLQIISLLKLYLLEHKRTLVNLIQCKILN